MTVLFFVILIAVLLVVAGILGLIVNVIGWIIGGLIIGALARFLVKNTQGLGLMRTMLAGIAGSIGGGLLARPLHAGGLVEFLLAIVVAALVIGALTGAIGSLATLDFLGFGLPASAPSLGNLTLQAKQNLQATWLGFTAFFTFAIMLSLLVFIFEGVRDAFDPRKTFR